MKTHAFYVVPPREFTLSVRSTFERELQICTHKFTPLSTYLWRLMANWHNQGSNFHQTLTSPSTLIHEILDGQVRAGDAELLAVHAPGGEGGGGAAVAARRGRRRDRRDGHHPLQHPADEGAGHGLPEGPRAAARQAAPRHLRTHVLPQVSCIGIIIVVVLSPIIV